MSFLESADKLVHANRLRQKQVEASKMLLPSVMHSIEEMLIIVFIENHIWKHCSGSLTM